MDHPISLWMEEDFMENSEMGESYSKSFMSCLFHVLIFPNYSGCAHTQIIGQQWFSVELPTAQKVTKVQIARRMEGGCCWHQGQNIKITIGPSRSYDPNEPTCLPEIRELKRQSGLQDYMCTDNPPPGKFVKLSKIGSLVLCEVKVFILKNVSGGYWFF